MKRRNGSSTTGRCSVNSILAEWKHIKSRRSDVIGARATVHLAWSCKEQALCGHCAGKHERQNCPPDTAPSCIDCNGPHVGDSYESAVGASTDRVCQVGPLQNHRRNTNNAEQLRFVCRERGDVEAIARRALNAVRAKRTGSADHCGPNDESQ